MRRTVSKWVSWAGVGLHSNLPCRVSIGPNSGGQGIVLNGKDVLKYDAVDASMELCTWVKFPHAEYRTIEHLLAAVYGLGIDDCIVEMDAVEAPIMDGSSKNFVDKLKDHIVPKLSTRPSVLKVTETVSYFDEKKQSFAELAPPETGDDDVLEMDVFVDDFGGRLPVTDRLKFTLYRDDFSKEIAPARTFGFQDQIEFLRKNKLALGGNQDNCNVFKGDGTNAIINPHELRFPRDEWLRHKLLDCIGDLSLSGHRIHGKFTANRPSHSTTNKLLRKLFANPKSFHVSC